MKVFVDTSAFVALRNNEDPNHAAARGARDQLTAEGVRLFTSNFVFAETYTALLVRIGREEAIRWGRLFRTGESLELIRVDEEIEERAWEILELHDDKRWSYVDATSFALIEREGKTHAFAFDQHFRQRGLRTLPVT